MRNCRYSNILRNENISIYLCIFTESSIRKSIYFEILISLLKKLNLHNFVAVYVYSNM